MKKSKIEISETELMTLLHCVEDTKVKSTVKIKEYNEGLESGHYSEKYKEGFEDKVKVWLETEKDTVKHLENLRQELISRFVEGEASRG